MTRSEIRTHEVGKQDRSTVLSERSFLEGGDRPRGSALQSHALQHWLKTAGQHLYRGSLAFVFYLAFLFCAPVDAIAQIGDTGQIQGTATDSSGAVIAGATVTATATATNYSTTTVTNDGGFYTFPSLRVGQYSIRVEKQGFQTVVHSGITLSVQQVAVVDMKLAVGEVADTVQVTGEPPLLETQDASQGQVIESKRIAELPLNGRDYVQLALLSQGAVQPLASARAGGFSTGGQRTTQNNYLLNGLDNNDMEIAWQGRQAEVVKPIVDAIQEFKVQTNGYSAEFGRGTGGVLNLTTKSGTNQFHGVLWEFFRNEKLDAREYFNTYPATKAPFKRNQFGGALGGPIVRDKMFFFQALEWQRRRESLIVVNTLPTVKERTGDFSELSTVIYDPHTYNSATNTRTAYSGNVIPTSQIDPVAKAAIDLIPAPQTSALTSNYTFTRPNGFDQFNSDSRVDFYASKKDNFAGTFDYSFESDPRALRFPGVMGGGALRDITGQVASLQWSHFFTPNFFGSTRVGWNRRFTASQTGVDKNYNSVIGLTGVSQTVPTIANLSVTGYNIPGGPNTTPNLSGSQNRQWVTDFSWVKGKHQIKFGMNLEWLQASLSNPQTSTGSFTFNGRFTRNPKTSSGGNGFADLLLGIPYTATVDKPVLIDMRANLDSWYLQDTWRVTPRLTFDFGVRYEVFLPWIDRGNRLANVILPTTGSQVTLQVAQDGSGRPGRALMAADKNNVAPRFGFAFDPGHGTVIRGFYGIFYGNFEPTGGGQFIETNPPFKLSAQLSTDGITPAMTFSGGVPDILSPSNLKNPVLSFFPAQITMPYNQMFNLNVQHTFAKDWMVQVGYFGTTAHHLLKLFDLNQPAPGAGDVNSRRPYKSFVYPGTTTTITPLAGFSGQTFTGNANYNSGQVKLEKRMSHGFTILSSYIYSRSLSDICGLGDGTFSGQAPGCAVQNSYNLRAEYGLDNQHIKHRFVASYIYQLPFGHNRAFGKNWNGAVNAVLGGWSTDGILTFTSGVPFTITVSSDLAGTGNYLSVQRPNQTGNPARPAGANPVAQFFNTAAFTPAAAYTFGTLGRNTMTGPGYSNMDAGLFKNTKFYRSADLQFRFEVFNVTNTPQFSTPGNSLTPGVAVSTTTFGQITSTVGNSRKLQFGAKVSF